MKEGRLIQQVLLDSARVTAIVGDRVAVNINPGFSDSPYIVHRRITGEEFPCLSGMGNGDTRAEIDISCYSRDVGEAEALALAARDAIVEALAVTGITPQQLYDNQARMHESLITANIWFSAAQLAGA